MRNLLLTLLVLLSGSRLAAADIAVGQMLPTLTIEDGGELVIDSGGSIRHVRWSSDDLAPGTVRILQYMAGRPSVERHARTFSELLSSQSFDVDAYQLINIVNLDDVTLGAARFAASAMERNKLATPDITLVADAGGAGLERWKLIRRTIAVIVLDREGSVVYFHKGGMDDGDRREALAAITAALAVE